MKKLIILITILAFLGCDKDSTKSKNVTSDDLIGTWILISATITQNGSVIDELDPSEDEVTLIIITDGEYTWQENGEIYDSGEWSLSSGVLTMLEPDGESYMLECSISGNELTLTGEIVVDGDTYGIVYIFIKSTDSNNENGDTSNNLISYFDRNSFLPIIENTTWTYNYGSTVKVTNIDTINNTFSIENVGSSGQMNGIIAHNEKGVYIGYSGFSGPEYLPIRNYFGYSPLLYENSIMIEGFNWTDSGNSNGYLYNNELTVSSTNITIVTPDGTIYENCIVLQRAITHPNGYNWDPYLVNVLYYIKEGIGFVYEIQTWSDGSQNINYLTSYNIPQGSNNDSTEAGSNSDLVGTWTRYISEGGDSFTSFIRLNEDFTVEAGGVDGVEYITYIEATYLINGNQISVEDNSCTFNPGIYNYTINNNSLTLAVVNDECNGRINTLHGTWTRQ